MSEINKQVYAFFMCFSSDLSSGGETWGWEGDGVEMRKELEE